MAAMELAEKEMLQKNEKKVSVTKSYIDSFRNQPY